RTSRAERERGSSSGTGTTTSAPRAAAARSGRIPRRGGAAAARPARRSAARRGSRSVPRSARPASGRRPRRLLGAGFDRRGHLALALRIDLRERTGPVAVAGGEPALAVEVARDLLVCGGEIVGVH